MKKIFYMTLLTSLLLLMGIKVAAAEIPYSVTADLPENQIDKEVTYFSLLVKEKQVQTITTEIKSNIDKEQVVTVELNPASTNENGVIDYSKASLQEDVIKGVRLNEMVDHAKQEIKLAPHETKQVSFQLKIPDDPFKGTVLGGLTFSPKTVNDEKSQSTVSIKNRYVYVIGVKLQEDLTPVQSQLQLMDVTAALSNYHTAIKTVIQNSQPCIMKNLTMTTEIKKQGSEKVLVKEEKEGIDFAPQSTMTHPVLLNDQQLEPGKYLATILLHDKEENKDWKFTKEFTITNTKAKSINRQAVGNTKTAKNTSFINIQNILLVLLILIIFILILKLRRTKK